MKLLAIYCVSIAGSLLIPLLLAAQDNQRQQDESESEKIELKVGDYAPEFVLKDQSGQPRNLGDLAADQRVALVFHRSAAW